MARRYYSSTARRTTLAADINSSVTSLTVAAVSGWPSSFPYTLVLDEGTLSEELVEVTARSGTTVTVTRGVDGTSAVAHTAGATVNHGVSARDFNEPNQFLNEGGTVTGATLVSANSASTALEVRQTGAGLALRIEDEANPDSTPVVVDASGDLGVGTATPDARLVVVEGGSQAAVRITNTGTGNSLVVEDSANPDSTPFVVDASGNVGIGTTTPVGLLDVYRSSGDAVVQLQGDASAYYVARQAVTSTSGPLIFMDKARGTIATPSVVSSGDTVGLIRFRGHDGTAFRSLAQVQADVDGTPGTNDMPGRLVFSTTADGASTPTERMRITNAGNVGIGTGAPGHQLHVLATGSSQNLYLERQSDTTPAYQSFYRTRASNADLQSGDEIGRLEFIGKIGGGFPVVARISSAVDATPGAGDAPGRLTFFTTPDGSATLSERMRIDNAGNVGIGTGATIGARFHVSQADTPAQSLFSGTTRGVRIGHTSTGTFIEGVDHTGVGSYQPLIVGGSEVRFLTSATERMRIDGNGLITGTGSSLGAWTAYTPTISSGTGAITSYTSSGYYTRIGKIVHAIAYVTITSNGTGASYVNVDVPLAIRNVTPAPVGQGREDGVTGNALQWRGIVGTGVARAYTYNNAYPGATNAVLLLSITYETSA